MKKEFVILVRVHSKKQGGEPFYIQYNTYDNYPTDEEIQDALWHYEEDDSYMVLNAKVEKHYTI